MPFRLEKQNLWLISDRVVVDIQFYISKKSNFQK